MFTLKDRLPENFACEKICEVCDEFREIYRFKYKVEKY